MGDAVRNEQLEFATTQKPSTVRMTAARTTTLVMGSRPVPLSPAAKSVEMKTIPADVVFKGEKLSTVDDFVRLRLQARTITFLGVLNKEGITPEYYATMCERFEAARRADPALEQRYRERLALGAKLLGR